jgi:hypothetical protein
MVITLADDVDTMVDDQPIALSEQGQDMHENTPPPQPSAPVLRPQTAEPRQRPRTLHTHVEQQLLIDSAGDDSFPSVPLPIVPLPNVPLPGACPDGLVGEGWTSSRVTDVALVVVFRLGLGSCLSCLFPLF